MLRHSLRLTLILNVVLLLSACGLSPQQVYPEPRLSGTLAPVGQGQTVNVQVKDQRTSTVIGTRGGLYDQTNALTVVGKTVLPRLQAETEAGLRMQGFTPVPAGQAASEFTLALVELTYGVAEGRSAFGEAQLSASYRVNLRKAGHSYQGEYTAKLKKGFIKTPSDAANNELVTQVMSDALQRVFQDPGIARFLAE